MISKRVNFGGLTSLIKLGYIKIFKVYSDVFNFIPIFRVSYSYTTTEFSKL